MLAKQVSRNREIYCTAETPLTEVFNKMTELNCACMPIVETHAHKNIIGTITEHDICVKLIGGELNPRRTSAGRVMNGRFTTVSGDSTIDECAELMRLADTATLFVVDENGAFLGVLTEEDAPFPEQPVVSLEPAVADFTVAPVLPTKIQLAH